MKIFCLFESLKHQLYVLEIFHSMRSAYMEYFLDQVRIFDRVDGCVSRSVGYESTLEEYIEQEARQVVGTVPAGTCLTCPSFLRSDWVASCRKVES